MCKRVFARETNLASHLELHQKKAAMGITEVKEKLSKDKKKVLKEPKLEMKEWKCGDCDEVFIEHKELKYHRRKVHCSKGPKQICPHCDKTFSTESAFQKHTSVHTGPFVCPVCHERNEEIVDHMKHMGDKHQDKTLTCTICDKVVLSKPDLYQHVTVRHEKEPEEKLQSMYDLLYQECQICQEKFLKKNDLANHMDTVHEEEKSEVCFFCDKSFIKKAQLNTHIGMQHKTMAVYECRKCLEDVAKKDLYNHGKVQHLPPYNCNECKTEYESRNEMEQHQFEEHDGGFSCKKCDVKFTYSHELRTHYKNHEPGSQPFLCDECGEGFEIKPLLKTHVLQQHFKNNHSEMLKHHPEMSGVNNAITCLICGEFNFDFKMVFAKHMRDDHFNGDLELAYTVFPWLKANFPPPGDPPTCDTCGREFLTLPALKAHMKDHEPSKTYSKKPAATPKKAASDEENEYEEEQVDFTHIEPRETEKAHKCEFCDESFTRKVSLKKHIKSRHKKGTTKAAIGKLEEREEEIDNELENELTEDVAETIDSEVSKSPRKKVKLNFCQICEEMFKTMEELISHVKSVHEDNDDKPEDLEVNPVSYDLEKKACLLCSTPSNMKNFFSRYGVRRHMRNCHGITIEDDDSVDTPKSSEKKKKPAKDKISTSLFNKKDTPKSQLKKPKSKKPLGKGAMNISINTDMDSTADEMDYEETNDISAFLGKNFNLGKAVQGMISDEMERDARECKECNESFSCLDTLKKHKILHEMKKNPYLKLDEEILGKIYACKQCKNMYSNALSLIHHNRSKHDGDHEEEILSYVDEVDGILKKIKEIQEQNKGKTSKAKKRKMSLPESDASSRAKKREKLDIATEPESMTSPPQFSKTGRRITKSRKLVEQFSCYKCNKSFDMERSLKNHIKLAHDAKESPIKAQSSPVSGYECSKCNRVFDEMVNLRRHTLMKHKERWEATGLKSENSASAQVSTSTMIYECDVCNQKFSVLSALRHHMISVHDEDDEGDVKVKEEALACTICSQEFASQHTLKIHMRKHTGEKPHTCCVCSNSFISKFKLHLHLKKIHAKLWMKKVHCKTCFALFDNEKAMLKHKDEHNRRDEEEDISDSGSLQHKCKECGKSFKWKKNLDSHMKFFHEETSTKTCGVCNKVFPNNKLIEEHMKTHSNNCNYCGKHYTSENVLKTHESQCRSKKTSEGKMTCDICKKNFASKAKLLEHMLNHTSIKSAKCDHCLESFKDESSLKSHKCKAKKTTKQSGTKTESKKDKLPTNKKGLKKMPSKFACGKCGKKFSKLYQVRDHKRLVHKISVSDKSSSIQTRRSSAEAESTSKYGMRTASERKASAGNQDTDDNVKTTSKQYTPSTPQASSSEMKTSSKNVTSSSKLTPKPSGVKTPKTSGTPQQKGSSKAAGKTPKPIGKATLTPKGTGQGTKSKKEAQTVTSSSSKSIEKSGEEVHKVAVCPICSKTLKMKRYLRDHLKNVHKIASEKINETIEKAKTKRVKCLYCRECHKMFWSNSLYEEHIRQMHPDKAALELDKQVMEQLIKTEVRSPPVPTLMEGDASDVQYKCEFCTSIMWTKDSFDDHIIEFHPEHVVEYGIPQEALSKSMDENSDEDPSNTLDVEVYQGLTCEQLSTQPVVRLQKMPASPSKKAQNLEVKEKGEDMGAEEHAGKGIEKLTKGQDASSEDSNGSVNDTDIQKESNRTSENENSSDTKTMTECDKEQTYDVDEIQRQAMETEMPAVDYYEFESNKDGEINTSTVSTENATPDAGTDTCEKSVTSPDKDTPQLPDDGDSQQEGQKDVTLKKECPESDDVEHVDSKEDDSEPCIDDVKKDDEITTDSPVDKNIFAVDQTTTNSTSEVGHDSIEQTKDKGNDEDVNQEYEAEKGDMVSVEINKEAMENGSPILELFVKTESEIRPDIVDDMSIVPNFGQYSEITDLPISGGQETGQTDEGNQDDPIIEPALQKPDSPVTESEQPSLVSIEEDIPAQYGGTVGVAETNKMNVLDSLESAGVNYNSFEQHVEYKAVSEQDTGRINEQNDVNIPHNETQGTDIQGVLTGELSDYEPMDFE
ncbi:XFIN-like protein [Mya arenaria]|uniref:XFIN-like protein n=2 Tax=Mya arenaria TaxID=6604 RepID=A0ABY7EUY0_MYAAR|nr:XFIN-like protein [Mya arenaria]